MKPTKPKKDKSPTLRDVVAAADKAGAEVSFEFMPNADCCASCKFSQKDVKNPNQRLCRRYPRHMEVNVGYSYPPHMPHDWCGEFKRRVET